jgi:hypothetical protein
MLSGAAATETVVASDALVPTARRPNARFRIVERDRGAPVARRTIRTSQPSIAASERSSASSNAPSASSTWSRVTVSGGVTTMVFTDV